MVRVVTGRMQETAPLIAVAFILPVGGCFDVYKKSNSYNWKFATLACKSCALSASLSEASATS